MMTILTMAFYTRTAIFTKFIDCLDKTLTQIYFDYQRLCSNNKKIVMRSTSRHIFEKVLICIERGMYSVHFKEMNLFKKYIFLKKVFFFFTSQLSCSHPLASLEKKRNTFYNNQNCTLYI